MPRHVHARYMSMHATCAMCNVRGTPCMCMLHLLMLYMSMSCTPICMSMWHVHVVHANVHAHMHAHMMHVNVACPCCARPCACPYACPYAACPSSARDGAARDGATCEGHKLPPENPPSSLSEARSLLLYSTSSRILAVCPQRGTGLGRAGWGLHGIRLARHRIPQCAQGSS